MLFFRLKEIRSELGISRYKLSKISGVNESTIQMIENSNDPNPTFKVMCKIADALGVTLEDLRRNEDESIKSAINRRTTCNR